jgi:hypothetical protein
MKVDGGLFCPPQYGIMLMRAAPAKHKLQGGACLDGDKAIDRL